MRFLVFALLLACQSRTPTQSETPSTPDFALFIHGGAGTIPRTMPPTTIEAYRQDLRAALRRGRDLLAAGGNSLDVVEEVVVMLEDNPRFNAGKGAVFNHAGGHELDASIMDGRKLACGAVASVQRVKNPIRLARRVMTDTPHILLAGAGAEKLATQVNAELVPPAYFHTEHRRQQWHKKRGPVEEKGTVGAVARDRHGNLAAATSTGGMTDKRFGRIGDSPIIGAGTYADNRTCAVSATGKGEEFIRHAVARMVAARMELRGETLAEAATAVVQKTLRRGDGGIIAVDRHGALVAEFNTEGMYRGAADANGRFEVAIW